MGFVTTVTVDKSYVGVVETIVLVVYIGDIVEMQDTRTRDCLYLSSLSFAHRILRSRMKRPVRLKYRSSSRPIEDPKASRKSLGKESHSCSILSFLIMMFVNLYESWSDCACSLYLGEDFV